MSVAFDQKLESIARICHEVNRAFCVFNGETVVSPEWKYAPDWMKISCADGILAFAKDQEATPEKMHELWTAGKIASGWKYGPTKDATLLTHPCMVPYADLPRDQRFKDELFLTICRAMLT